MSYTAAPIIGPPGIQAAARVTFRQVFYGGADGYLNFPGGAYVAGAIARDPANVGNEDVLQVGMMLGRATSGSYSGYFGVSIIGVLTGAVSASGTSVTVSAAQATEVVRRIGSTGTIRLVGPPTANGTVATFTETYSAVNTTTGVITTSSLDADLVAGSFVCANDGTYLPISFISEPESGFKVTDNTGANTLAQWWRVPIAGIVDQSKLLPVWPTDTSLQAWIVASLNATAGAKFVFQYGITG